MIVIGTQNEYHRSRICFLLENGRKPILHRRTIADEVAGVGLQGFEIVRRVRVQAVGARRQVVAWEYISLSLLVRCWRCGMAGAFHGGIGHHQQGQERE